MTPEMAMLGLMFLDAERDALSKELDAGGISRERVDEIFDRMNEINSEEESLCEEAGYSVDDRRDTFARQNG